MKKSTSANADIVLGCLRGGRAMAKTSSEISDETGLTDVDIRAAVRYLIMHRETFVASATSRPAGFFIPNTQSEKAKAIHGLVSRGKKILGRAYKAMGLSSDHISEQMSLDLGIK